MCFSKLVPIAFSLHPDEMTVRVEAESASVEAIATSVRELLKLRGTVEIVAPGSLPNDGKVIDDRRSYD